MFFPLQSPHAGRKELETLVKGSITMILVPKNAHALYLPAREVTSSRKDPPIFPIAWTLRVKKSDFWWGKVVLEFGALDITEKNSKTRKYIL